MFQPKAGIEGAKSENKKEKENYNIKVVMSDLLNKCLVG